MCKSVQAVLSLFCALYANQFKCGVFIMCIICKSVQAVLSLLCTYNMCIISKSVQAVLSLLCALYANQFKLCCLYYMHYMQISSRCVVFIMCIYANRFKVCFFIMCIICESVHALLSLLCA